MQQELGWLPFRTRVHAAAGNVGAAGWAHGDCSDSGNWYRSAVPAVCILVDGRWKRGDVELIRCLTIECPGRPLGLVDVDVELKLAPVGSIGRDIKGDFSVFLSSSVSSSRWRGE
jgi:hypothetical protein